VGFLHPVGPEPPSTYWVRRALVLIALLLVVALLWWLFIGRSSSTAGAGSPPTTTPTPTRTVTTTAPTTSSHTASTAPTGSTTSSTSGTTADCTNADLKVRVTTNAQSYPPAQDPTFTLSVTNTSSTTCLRDVGSAAEELTVTSGQTRIWSSDDCNPPGTSSVSLLRPGEPVSVSVQWGRTFSQPGCPTGQPDAQAGTYQVSGRVGSKRSAPATFSLT
jgi:hypothetical protein